MIDFEKYKDRFTTAQEQKEGSKFRDKILEELKKTEWSERKAELDKSLQNIKEEKDFDKYQKDLAKLFNDIFEVITAPGVEAFANWINYLTDNKSETNIKKLRKFLVDNYADYSESVDSITTNKNALEIPDNSIFSTLLAEVRKAIKKQCNDFLGNPTEFENNIDDFLRKLDENLSGLADIEELAYTKIEELYSDEQRNNSIDFYTDIIEKIAEENQNLKSISDSEKNDSWLEKINTRITDIRKCIKLLDKTDIATNQDETIKKLFLKFDNEMVDAKKGIVDALDIFIENSWREISDNYFKIKEYFNNETKITANIDDLESNFPKKSSIVALIDNYKNIFNDNPLASILNIATKDIENSLKKKAKAIEKHEQTESELKTELSEVFESLTQEYIKKIPLLENLSASDNSLQQKVQDIKQLINDLQEAYERCNENKLITYLNDYFTSDLNTYRDITTWFTEVLEKSGMKDELDWLNARLNESEAGNISKDDFDEKTLRDLLSKGLITLTITKTFQ